MRLDPHWCVETLFQKPQWWRSIFCTLFWWCHSTYIVALWLKLRNYCLLSEHTVIWNTILIKALNNTLYTSFGIMYLESVCTCVEETLSNKNVINNNMFALAPCIVYHPRWNLSLLIIPEAHIRSIYIPLNSLVVHTTTIAPGKQYQIYTATKNTKRTRHTDFLRQRPSNEN